MSTTQSFASTRHLRAPFLLMFVSAGWHTSAAATDYLKDYVKNCASISLASERLECFDRVSEGLNAKSLGDPVAKDTWRLSESNKVSLDQDRAKFLRSEEKRVANEKAHENDKFFLRGSTDVGEENEDAASFALSRSGEKTSGKIKAAVLYVNKGGIPGVFERSADAGKKFYIGLGVHRDDSDPNAKVATNDIKVGYQFAIGIPRKKKTPGIDQFSWVSFGRVSDIAQSKVLSQFEGGYEWSRRWFKEPDNDGNNGFDRLLTARVSPFTDRNLDEKTGARTATSGTGMELSFKWYRPVYGKVLGKQLTPDTLHFSSKRIAGFSGTQQYSTMNKASVTWDLATHAQGRTQPSLTLAREIGSDFRAGTARAAKTLLTMDLKYN